MNPEDLKVLAERASTVEGRLDKRLDEVHARIRSARRRRHYGAVSAAVVAVVLALTTGVGLLALTDTDRTPPAEPAPRPTAEPSEPEDNAPSVRPLTYAVGGQVHFGDRTFDAGREVLFVDATDDGAVFVTGPSRGSGRNDVWFTDGSDVKLLGHTSGSSGWAFGVNVSRSGSNVVWWQTEKPVSNNVNDRGEHVVYDTAKGREIARFGGFNGSLQAVYDDRVYWIPNEDWCLDFDKYHGVCRRYRAIMRLDTSNGSQVEVPWASYRADARSSPRTLVRSGTNDKQGEVDPYFWRVGSRLVGIGGRPPAVPSYDFRVDDTSFESRAGKLVRLRVPESYVRSDVFQLVQWLDDDRVALFAYCCGTESADFPGYPVGGSEVADPGDIFVCTLSSGKCTLTVKGSESTGYQVPMAD